MVISTSAPGVNVTVEVGRIPLTEYKTKQTLDTVQTEIIPLPQHAFDVFITFNPSFQDEIPATVFPEDKVGITVLPDGEESWCSTSSILVKDIRAALRVNRPYRKLMNTIKRKSHTGNWYYRRYIFRPLQPDDSIQNWVAFEDLGKIEITLTWNKKTEVHHLMSKEDQQLLANKPIFNGGSGLPSTLDGDISAPTNSPNETEQAQVTPELVSPDTYQKTQNRVGFGEIFHTHCQVPVVTFPNKGPPPDYDWKEGALIGNYVFQFSTQERLQGLIEADLNPVPMEHRMPEDMTREQAIAEVYKLRLTLAEIKAAEKKPRKQAMS